jgi:hypothetical protein
MAELDALPSRLMAEATASVRVGVPCRRPLHVRARDRVACRIFVDSVTSANSGRARACTRVAKLAELCSVWLIVGLTLVLVVFPLVVIWLVARAFLFIARVIGELIGAWARAGRA